MAITSAERLHSGTELATPARKRSAQINLV